MKTAIFYLIGNTATQAEQWQTCNLTRFAEELNKKLLCKVIILTEEQASGIENIIFLKP